MNGRQTAGLHYNLLKPNTMSLRFLLPLLLILASKSLHAQENPNPSNNIHNTNAIGEKLLEEETKKEREQAKIERQKDKEARQQEKAKRTAEKAQRKNEAKQQKNTDIKIATPAAQE